MTEESLKQLKTQIAYNPNIQRDKYGDHCFVLEEKDVLARANNNFDDYSVLVKEIESFVKKHNIQILFFDNLTTSEFYDGRINSANALLSSLRVMAQDLNMPIVMVAHSGGDVYGQSHRIDAQQVRGSKASVNKTEYLYTFIRKTMVIPEDVWSGITAFAKEYAFVEVLKSRAHAKESGTVYQLLYDSAAKTYGKDVAIEYEDYLEMVAGKKKK
jgi:hypothetical protein